MSKNKDQLNVYDAITNVDEDLIEAAVPKRKSGLNRINKNTIISLVSVIAACLFIGIFAGIRFFG